ncbi:MAG: ATP-binding protein [Polyangiaceae bacterium]
MTLHAALALLACLANLAFAIVAWQRRGQSPLALLLGLLFLDVFAWNFADLASQLTGERGWQLIDRACSSMLPALALHVVALFVGRVRELRAGLVLAYGAFAVLALWPLGYSVWWKVLLGGALATMLYAARCLVLHLRQTRAAQEKSRTRLVLFALVVGTMLGSSDVWSNKIGLAFPPLSSVGMLGALGLFGVAVLRLDLLGGGRIPRLLLLYALGLALVGLIAYLAAVRWLPGGLATLLIGLLTVLVIALAALREHSRVTLVAEERARRLAGLGRLSEQLAHDLRNPLAALKGALQFLAGERALGRSLDAHPEFLELMLEQTLRLERNVAGYQRLARVEPAPVRACLNEIVREVLVVQRLALSADVVLDSELEGELPRCMLDKDLVMTALENLLRNAAEALRAGGTISVSTERLSLDRVALSVRDDGAGMDARQLACAGDEFFSTKESGSGLGLSFARRVAHAHGGQLEIHSELGVGTRVRLTFPVAR